jgi:putative tryptophan/tyrosine transport system substrate-binding protein
VARIAAFHQALQGLGWNVGRNIRVESRWAVGERDRIRKFADE